MIPAWLVRTAAGFLAAAFTAFLARRAGALSTSGAIAAAIVGTASVVAGWNWGTLLVLYFVASTALSRIGIAEKDRRTGGVVAKGGARDAAQVFANGGVFALGALAASALGAPSALVTGAVGALAAAAADTWATEIGILSIRSPRLITSWRTVEPGTSGGVTAYGILASSAGALMIGLVLLLLTAIEIGNWQPWLLPAALMGGLAGSLADSLLGATAQAIYQSPSGETERGLAHDGTPNPALRGWRWMNNDLVNLLSSVVGGLVAVAIFRMLGA